MTVEDMHYDFKSKLNKIDSQRYRNLQIPEIDWKLNEAQYVFIRSIFEPKYRNQLGIEITQRNTDDIRTIIKDNVCISTSQFTSNSEFVTLPEDYMYYLRGYVLSNKNPCGNKKIRLTIEQHDDEFEESPFDKSSYEWEEVNGNFFENGIRVFNDGTFTNTQVCIDFIRKPAYIQFAQGTVNSQYRLPNGTLLTGKQDCELPYQVHYEIVDIAVLIATGDMQIPDYNIKLNKIKIND